MSSPATRRAPAPERFPLIGHAEPEAIAAWRRGEAVTAGRFLAEVLHVARAMPDAGHVINFCSDRYRFALALCAAMVRGQVTLLPPAATRAAVEAMRAFAPGAYGIADDDALDVDLPRFRMPEGAPPPARFDVPAIPADQEVACLFTSGSTGEPRAYRKHWGSLVRDVAAEARHLGVGDGCSIVGTVPPQHMYGFESTVLLPLVAGAALCAERPYLPAEIDAVLARLPAPRVLFITPFHLRAWIEGGEPVRIETVVSATAPLSVNLARRAEETAAGRLLEIYGCTETGQIAMRRPTLGTEWEAFEGIRVWNDGEQAMAAGGHIEATTPLNDVIEPLGDGTRFLLLGRSADMVNIAGKRNSLGNLNHQLTAIPGVADGAFFLPDEGEADGVGRLMAFAVAPGLSAAQVVAALRERIDAAFLPRPLVIVERLPRAITGKIPRAALEALVAETRKRTPGGA